MGNRIAGITVEIGGDTTKLSKSLESVNKTIKETQSQLKDVEKLLKLDPSNTELLSQKQEALGTKITATKEKLDALKAAQEQAKAQMESGDLGKDKYDALQREIIEVEQELKNLAKEAANANTALNKIEQAGKTMESVGKKMSAAGSTLTRTVTGPILAIGTAAVKTTMDFDAQMSKVSAISGATGEDFDKLREKAREMGAKTKFSATEAAEGYEYMAMAGWKTGDMLEGIEGIMNLAAASGEDLATTSDIVTDALTAFGLKAADSGHFADVLAAASSNANTNVSMLGESFKYAAPVAGALGISAEDTSLALGLMANAGIKASQAGTALRTGLTNLAKPTKQMQTYMKKYNVSLVQNKDGSVNLRETLISLREKMGNLSETQQAAAASAIFGKNSMAGWLALINASDEDFEKLTSAIDNCDGSAQQMAETMQDNLAGQITILKSALQELMIQIGDALMPTIRNIVSHIQSFVEKLQQMDEGTRNTILRVAAFAAALGPVLLIVGKLTSGIGSAMQSIASLGKGILTLVNQAKLGVGAGGSLAKAFSALTGPIGAVIAVIAILVAAFVHLWNTNEEFRQKVTAIWESVKAKFQELADKISELLGGVEINFSTITQAIGQIWDGFCQLLAPVFEGVFTLIANILNTALNTITGLLDVFKGLFTGDWDTFWNGISTIFSGVWNGIVTHITTILNTIKGVADVFLGWFGTNWDNVWNGIVTCVTTAIETVKTVVANGWEAVKNTVTTLGENIKTAASTLWENLKTTVSTTVENLKQNVSEAWENLKTNVTNTVSAIKDGIAQKWEDAKTAVTDTVDRIKEGVSNTWENTKTAVGNTVENIRGAVSDKWAAIRDSVTNIGDAIKSKVANTWDNAKEKVSGVVSSIKDTISTGFQAAKDKVTSVFDGIREKISNVMEKAKSTVQNAIDRIKQKFNFSWSLPRLKLPHLSISGRFSINPPSVPHFSISWYRKAMENGMILNSPTIFGMKGNQLLAGGEAGSETVVGTQSLMRMIQEAVMSMKDKAGINYGGVSINVYGAEGQDESVLAMKVADILNHQITREGAVWA